MLAEKVNFITLLKAASFSLEVMIIFKTKLYVHRPCSKKIVKDLSNYAHGADNLCNHSFEHDYERRFTSDRDRLPRQRNDSGTSSIIINLDADF